MVSMAGEDMKLAGINLVHELVHSAFASPRPWVSEGLAHFAEAVYREQQGGRQAALDLLGLHRAAFLDSEKEVAGAPQNNGGQPLSTTFDETYYRSKAAYVWWMLRDMVGSEALKQAIRNYRAADDTDPKYAERLIESAAKRDLTIFFDDWVYHDRGLPDFRVQSVHPWKTDKQAQMVTMTLENLGNAGSGSSIQHYCETSESQADWKCAQKARPPRALNCHALDRDRRQRRQRSGKRYDQQRVQDLRAVRNALRLHERFAIEVRLKSAKSNVAVDFSVVDFLVTCYNRETALALHPISRRCRNRTGSKHLINTTCDSSGKQGFQVLIDCGLFQGPKEWRERNWQDTPVPAREIDAVVLTHAHLDHCGWIPRLVKEGFRGPIYATQATIDLCSVVLPDSGHLQEEDAAFHNKRERRSILQRCRSIRFGEAQDCLQHFKTGRGRADHTAEPGASASASCLQRTFSGPAWRKSRCRRTARVARLLFTGDLGRVRDSLVAPGKVVRSGPQEDEICRHAGHGIHLRQPATSRRRDPRPKLAELDSRRGPARRERDCSRVRRRADSEIHFHPEKTNRDGADSSHALFIATARWPSRRSKFS